MGGQEGGMLRGALGGTWGLPADEGSRWEKGAGGRDQARPWAEQKWRVGHSRKAPTRGPVLRTLDKQRSAVGSLYSRPVGSPRVSIETHRWLRDTVALLGPYTLPSSRLCLVAGSPVYLPLSPGAGISARSHMVSCGLNTVFRAHPSPWLLNSKPQPGSPRLCVRQS